MATDSIRAILKKQKSILAEKYHVDRIGIFGSYARGEERTDSDIDILVEINGRIGWDFFDLQDYLEKQLGCKVDLVTERALKPQLKDKILKEIQYA